MVSSTTQCKQVKFILYSKMSFQILVTDYVLSI